MATVSEGQLLPDDVRSIPLLDEAGAPTLLGELVGGHTTVLVLLRHFGCLACSERVAQWKPELPKFEELGARVIFVGNGKPDNLREFTRKAALGNPCATIHTEPTQALHRALGLVNSLGSTISPGAMFNAFRAVTKGHLQLSVEGDALQQGGVLLLDPAGKVALLHREQQLGDFLAVSKVLNRVQALS